MDLNPSGDGRVTGANADPHPSTHKLSPCRSEETGVSRDIKVSSIQEPVMEHQPCGCSDQHTDQRSKAE